MRRRRSWKRRLLLLYACLLLASHAVRLVHDPERVLAPGEKQVTLPAVSSGASGASGGSGGEEHEVRLVWREFAAPEGEAAGLPVVLLHGSPGGKENFRTFADGLGSRRRKLLPDLPGFGSSTLDVPDYSVRAHAVYVLDWLDRLDVQRFHLVGFSMGGGVGIEAADLASNRVASLALVSSLGTQEYELFGDYHLNHLLHGAQLAGLWLVREGTPHFGYLDDAILGVPYARNFYDSDQRPLRGMLERWAGPTLVLHGDKDQLVPAAAALETHRLLPQSELQLFDGDHFDLFRNGAELGARVEGFLARVESGAVPFRADAQPARVIASAEPFDPRSVPPVSGFSLFLLLVLAALATLISEDLTCVAVGALAGQGRIGFLPGTLACFVGIFVGDMLLFYAGRWFGRRGIHRIPLRWFLSEARVERSSQWFESRGPLVIFGSRFLPGARLPTYFAAGVLRTSALRFAFWFALAAGLWTPILVWLASRVGGELTDRVELFRDHLALGFFVTVTILFVMVKIVVPLFSFRGRRLLLFRWRRTVRWEFWPLWVFYPPIVLYVLWLGIKHRGLTVFTAANPAIPAGGFIGESKASILHELMRSCADRVPQTEELSRALRPEERIAAARRFQSGLQEALPLVLKPDVGQRGEGVVVARTQSELEEALRQASDDVLLQEHVEGVEFGVFYYRRPPGPGAAGTPDEPGRVFSITEKRLVCVVGDGKSTLERLILADDRAVCMARFFLDQHVERLDEVPAAGERVRLGELGTHARGALFLDGGQATPELERTVDEISRGVEGFWFGRYDVIAPSVEEFRRGRFKIVELNGVTSEATHVYDPKNSVWTAWRTIAEQWRLAFEIGAANMQRGAPSATLFSLFAALRDYRQRGETEPVDSAYPETQTGLTEGREPA